MHWITAVAGVMGGQGCGEGRKSHASLGVLRYPNEWFLCSGPWNTSDRVPSSAGLCVES